MTGHFLIAGVTGSGKTYAEELLIKHLIKTDTDLIICDPKGTELMDYETKCSLYAAEESGILSAIQFAKVEMDMRFMRMREKHERIYSGRPMYLIIDEAGWINDIGSKYERVTALDSLYAISFRGRAAKVFLILATQRGTADILPRKILVNLDNKIVLRQDKPIDSRELIGIPDACNLPKIGWCYLKMPDFEGRARKVWVDDIVKYVDGIYFKTVDIEADSTGGKELI